MLWVHIQPDRRTELIYRVATFEGKIQNHFLPGVVPAVTVVTAKTPQYVNEALLALKKKQILSQLVASYINHKENFSDMPRIES